MSRVVTSAYLEKWSSTMYVYAVIDSEYHAGYVALCDSFEKACSMARNYVKVNYYEYDSIEDCESVWIQEIPLNEWL